MLEESALQRRRGPRLSVERRQPDTLTAALPPSAPALAPDGPLGPGPARVDVAPSRLGVWEEDREARESPGPLFPDLPGSGLDLGKCLSREL
eukprot:9473621-Pyramimonas_sp.AAC.1